MGYHIVTGKSGIFPDGKQKSKPGQIAVRLYFI
jgi:hypothetical protein